ncbi:MAG: hypothetical protein B6D39_05860 [Anaerolineae bacterium UTCFX2]|jgi:hypothetical protein|nr:hypothetical protein [Anaerolineae bacterium]MCZ7552953.1 hypothetical protein [Anaerolineales bacterium]OQY91764.1 MAG: hypothetical protein B6D39_05860 [Anaerolineae bacterium UTCFX2]
MTIHFDQKGKFFTDIVNKEPVQVIIQTETNVVRGKIHLAPESRLKDEINSLDRFFAVTDAVVYNSSGKEMYRCNFISLNREKIIWILPEAELSQSAGGGET